MDVQRPLDLPDQPEVSWQAAEVVRELDDRPHLLLRIRLRGGSFAQLDAQPFVRVLGRRAASESWFAEVSEDQTSFSGYFSIDAPAAPGIIEYGYGSRVMGRLPGPFDPGKVKRLERDRLPKDLVPVTQQLIDRKRAGRRPPELRMPPARRRRPG
jgi:hypothetical protein